MSPSILMTLGGYTSHDGLNIDGVLGYTFNNFDQKRGIVIGSFNRDVFADYDSHEGYLQLSASKLFKIDDTSVLNLRAGGTYLLEYREDYTETGAGGINREVEAAYYNTGILDFNMAFIRRYEMEDGRWIKPEFSIGSQYMIGDFRGEQSARFSGGTQTFTTIAPDISQFSFIIGTGVSAQLSETLSVAADYQGKFNAELNAHTFTTSLVYRW